MQNFIFDSTASAGTKKFAVNLVGRMCKPSAGGSDRKPS